MNNCFTSQTIIQSLYTHFCTFVELLAILLYLSEVKLYIKMHQKQINWLYTVFCIKCRVIANSILYIYALNE